MKIAVCQMRSGTDPRLNLLLVNDFVHLAVAEGAEAVFFPENTFYRGPRKLEGFSRSDIALYLGNDRRILPKNIFSTELLDMMESWPIAVSLGSVFESEGANAHFYNAHFWIDPGGRVTSYRKIHLFDYRPPTGPTYLESAEVLAGQHAVAVTCKDFRCGLSICYDLRFPELYRILSLKLGCELLLVPAAFTQKTGEAHWHTLLRARAIENQCYVIAAAQWGSHRNNNNEELFCYGHSLVYDPWGKLVCEAASTGDSLLIADIDVKRLSEVREKLPALQGAKFFHSILGTSEHW